MTVYLGLRSLPLLAQPHQVVHPQRISLFGHVDWFLGIPLVLGDRTLKVVATFGIPVCRSIPVKMGVVFKKKNVFCSHFRKLLFST